MPQRVDCVLADLVFLQLSQRLIPQGQDTLLK